MKLYAKFHSSGLCLELHEVQDYVNMPAPYVQQPDDVYLAWKAKQDVPPPEPPPSNDIPEAVSPRQIRRALNAAGLRKAVDDAVKVSSIDIHDDWEYSLEVRRDHPLLNTMAAQLGMTSAQLDGLFLAASQIP